VSGHLTKERITKEKNGHDEILQPIIICLQNSNTEQTAAEYGIGRWFKLRLKMFTHIFF
jgi:1,2-phenylacetyl-CoA epoxidase catalytic subunit